MRKAKKKLSWKEEEPEIRVNSLQELILKIGLIDGSFLLNISPRDSIILINNRVQKAIHEHLIQKKVELGGLLLGSVYSLNSEDSNSYAIVITHSISSVEFKSTTVSLSLGVDVWNAARPYLGKGMMVVGWYHSHPGFGAFFSSTDRYTQKHFFKEPYHIGLVVDPFRQEEKWFLGADASEAKHKYSFE